MTISVDTNCSFCFEPWDVWGLRHEGWGYLTDTQAEQLEIMTLFQSSLAGSKEAQQQVSLHVYTAVLSGKGCPNDTCGFDHGTRVGPYRTQQMHQLVIDGVTDDDPAMFL